MEKKKLSPELNRLLERALEGEELTKEEEETLLRDYYEHDETTINFIMNGCKVDAEDDETEAIQ